jgi:C-terminal processing protease CtpA/Prc
MKSSNGDGTPVRRIRSRLALLAITAAASAGLFTACGGGGGGGGPVTPAPRCTATTEKQFVLDVAEDWYLFPETLPANVNPGNYATAQDLLDAITTVARAQGKDRFFSYVTTREEDESFLREGEFIGFGFRSETQDSRLFLIDVFESTPAHDAGLRRGAEILAIDSGTGYEPIADLLARDPSLAAAFGPAQTGVQRGLRYRQDGVTTEVTLTKRLNTITPVPLDGGVRVLTLPSNPTVQVGYVALRSYISSAETPLVGAFRDRFQNLDYFIVDLRYNGGGLVSISDLLGDLFGEGRRGNDLYAGLRFNQARAAQYNTNRFFQPRADSVAPLKIAFITTGYTASASEMTANSMDPWVEVAIIGADTFGKPVGQSAFDQTGCDLRLRLVTFRTVNALERGDYYDGLASEVTACAAGDDLDLPMGDPRETSTAAALAWLGNSALCAPMSATPGVGLLQMGPEPERRLPLPQRPTAAQAWLPGLF